MKSIVQNKKVCFITGETNDLHEHHVYFGSKRKLSEKYGLKVYLIGKLHNLSEDGVHGKNGHALDLEIKHKVQIIAMDHYKWSVDDFIRIIGKSYL